MFYVTYNDTASGIYSSQVIDVVNFLNAQWHVKIKLVAFISLRSFFSNRKKIKNELSSAVVLPMIPGIKRWKINIFSLQVLCVIYKPKLIIGRSIFATQLALLLKQKGIIQKVVYDGRASVYAEWKEYNVGNSSIPLNQIFEIENNVVNNVDYSIAVSKQLVLYWQSEFNYKKNTYSVIPCTLHSAHESLKLSELEIEAVRTHIGFEINDMVFVYSGSLAGWQSIHIMFDFFNDLLIKNLKFKILFLSDHHTQIELLKQKFPKQVVCFKVNPLQVFKYLSLADYGILMRENSITNKVASPVKFAEYLAAGLNVIISPNIGDCTEFAIQNNCGCLVNAPTDFSKVSSSQKQANQKLALSHFSKQNYLKEYQKVLFI